MKMIGIISAIMVMTTPAIAKDSKLEHGTISYADVIDVASDTAFNPLVCTTPAITRAVMQAARAGRSAYRRASLSYQCKILSGTYKIIEAHEYQVVQFGANENQVLYSIEIQTSNGKVPAIISIIL